MTESSSKKTIQSYVYTDFGKFFVSTIFRQDSTPYASWFYETLVWELDEDNNRKEHILYQTEGLNNHYELCKQLLIKGTYDEDFK